MGSSRLRGPSGRTDEAPADHGLLDIDLGSLSGLSDADLLALTQQTISASRGDRKENALLYYAAVSEKAALVHSTKKTKIAIGGGNGSSKTETCIAEMIMCGTGVVPYSLRDCGIDWSKKCTGPMNLRVVCESVTTTLYNIILPKLQWWRWTGLLPTGEEGGTQGHYGWVPRRCLRNGDWNQSWQDKIRTLTILCFDPDDPERQRGETTIQFMSHDQDPSDFASGQFEIILHDEAPKYATWRENEGRAMRSKTGDGKGGRVMLAMTWPDDPSIPVDWIFDELYEPAQRGDPEIEWINLYTTENPHNNQEAVALQRKSWSAEVASVRIFGKPIRHAHRIHPLFTDQPDIWCFNCKKPAYAVEGTCSCGSRDVVSFNHVRDCSHVQGHWPSIFLLDPHPRKPHMGAWYVIDPHDDLWGVDEIVEPMGPRDFKEAVESREIEHGLRVVARMMDPNMGRNPSSTDRETTWQDEFRQVGLWMDLANDGAPGRKKLDELLAPDPYTRAPRIHWDPRCKTTILQMKRYVWDDYKQGEDNRDQKQEPRRKNDDFPTLAKYLMNMGPLEFRTMLVGPQVQHRLPSLREKRRRA